MATAMKISEDRVLITNLRSGSVYVDFFLTSADTGEEEDSSEDPTAQATPPTPNDDSTLNSMLATMQNSISSGTLNLGNIPILGTETKVDSLPNEVKNQPGEQVYKEIFEEKGVNAGMIIGIIIGVLIIIFLFIYVRRMRMRLRGCSKPQKLQESPSSIQNKYNDYNIVKMQVNQQNNQGMSYPM